VDTKPYKPGESKISKVQWERLNTFFKSIDPPAQDELFATGDHDTLYLMLRNELGLDSCDLPKCGIVQV